jgi:hypothetical protein
MKTFLARRDIAAHPIYYLDHNAASRLDGSAVVIIAAVEQWRKELTE